jgi:hypothetical protein
VAPCRVAFDLGAFDTSLPLIIDPILEYSTYLGEGDAVYIKGIDVDANGAFYVTGNAGTLMLMFPTTGNAFDRTYNLNGDAFVSKFSADGTTLIYSTFLGGQSVDGATDLAVDASGAAYVTGSTGSSDFPTTAGSWDATFSGGDGYLAKLAPSGGTLLYSTFVGGPAATGVADTIAVTADGAAVIAGATDSSNFPVTPGAYDTSHNGLGDAFVMKLNPAGSGRLYCTYLGGVGSDSITDIVCDAGGSVFVTGSTGSNDFPTTPGAFDSSLSGSSDAFVARLDSSGSALAYSSLLGGSTSDASEAVAVDAAGSFYLGGWTRSSNFPATPGAFDSSFNGCMGCTDGFVTKFDSAGALAYSTYIGGSQHDQITALAVMPNGAAYATGDTSSSNYPVTPDAYSTDLSGSGDGFVLVLDPAGTHLLWSTFLGGGLYDSPYTLALDQGGSIYVAGSTGSSDFPTTPNAIDRTMTLGTGGFIAKFSALCVVDCPGNMLLPSAPGACGATADFTVTGSGVCGAVVADPASGSFFPVGTTTVNVTAASGATCSFTVTVEDVEAPTVAVPSNMVAPMDLGLCSATVDYSASAADNCSGVSLSCSPASGAVFPAGVTTVTCTATDAAGNVDADSFTVTVVDQQGPTITCPQPIVENAAPGACSKTVDYTFTVGDNCAGPITITTNPPSGSSFNLGTTPVTITATDAAGNSSQCQTTVTVLDVTAPTISCPTNVQTIALTAAGRPVDYSTPAASDACSAASVQCVPASGGIFPVGTSTVTCTATDASTNTAQCSFTVEVAPIGVDTAGIYLPTSGSWFLRNANSPGAADLIFGYGPSGLGWRELRGDWNGDGTDSAGLYDPASGFFFLKNANAAGGADLVFGFGPGGLGWLPVVGDWDGNGTDTVGLYDPSTGFFFLRNVNAPGPADTFFGFGPGGLGWQPLVGDWDGNGTDTVGLYAPDSSFFFVRNANTPGPAETFFGFGPGGLGWQPFAGDWNGDGADTIGLYDGATGFYFLRNVLAPGPADTFFGYGPPGAKPLMGDWNSQ